MPNNQIKKTPIHIKVLTGHLTQTEKKGIKAVLNAGFMSGKVGRINYFLSEKDGIYTVLTTRVNKDPQALSTVNQIERMKSTFMIK